MAMGSVQTLLWSAPNCPEESSHGLRFMWGAPLPVDHDAFEAMVQELESVRGSLLQRRSESQDLSESDREALRALGYLDDE